MEGLHGQDHDEDVTHRDLVCLRLGLGIHGRDVRVDGHQRRTRQRPVGRPDATTHLHVGRQQARQDGATHRSCTQDRDCGKTNHRTSTFATLTFSSPDLAPWMVQSRY
jgi:hypothetical protein